MAKRSIKAIGTVHTVDEFLSLIKEKLPPEDGKTRFYRGHSDASYDLKPSVFRKDKSEGKARLKTNEKEILEEFCSYFHDETRDKTAFEKLMLAQHHGLPTRLLDVTLNPLVALYFACLNKAGEAGCVYYFNVDEGRILAPSSDKLRLISALAFVKREDKENIKNLIKKFNTNEQLNQKGKKIKDICEDDYETSYYRWFHVIKNDVPAFDELIVVGDLKKYFFIKPIYSNARIRAQSGGFVMTGFLEKYDRLGVNKRHKAAKIIIPCSCAKRYILEELDSMNINEMTLFPDMDHTADYIKDKYDKVKSGD